MSYGCWIGCCSNFKWCTLRSITSSRGSIAVGNEYDSAIPFLDFSSGCILSIINHKRFILYLLLRKNYGKFWIIPPFFLLMLLYQARKLSDHVFMCFWESNLPLSTIFLLDFGNVVFFVFILMEKTLTPNVDLVPWESHVVTSICCYLPKLWKYSVIRYYTCICNICL